MDLHFLLRNGISGGVFVLYFLIGIGIASDQPGELLDPLFKSFSRNAWQPTFLAASTPVIGIVLQGIYLLVLQHIGWMFEDDARRFVAARICQTVNEWNAWPKPCQSELSDYEQDPIFVAFYYSHAPAHLVEWARRRRSYHYLGWTVSLGAVLGLGLGVAWVGFIHHVAWANVTDPVVAFILLCTVAGVLSAIVLSTRMQRDVDQMEAIWALAHLDPRVGSIMGVGKIGPHGGSIPPSMSLAPMTQTRQEL